MPGRAITQVCPQCQMPLVLPASFAGRKIPCTRCGSEVLVREAPVAGEPTPTAKVTNPPATTSVPAMPPQVATRWAMEEPPEVAPPVPRPDPKPPHLQASGAKVATNSKRTEKPVESEAEEEETEEPPQPRSPLVVGCLLLSMLSMAATAVLAVVLLVVWIAQFNGTRVATPEPETPLQRRALDKRLYTNAAKKSALYSGVLVRIDRAEVGKVRYRSKGEILETSTPYYLMITLNVKNKSRAEPFEYQSWYSYEFQDEGEEQGEKMELIDENGRDLPFFPIPGAENVERHLSSSSLLPPGDDTYDTLVFKLDSDYLDQPIPDLYLTLPLAAVADRGEFRFLIPGSMVQRRD